LSVSSCDSSLPHRELSAGDCFASSDCSDPTQVCRNNQCVGCIDHGECQSQVCDTYGDLPGGGAGKCLPTTNIVYVSNKSISIDDPCVDAPNQDGSKSAPYCTITQAINTVKSQTGKMIRVLSSPNIYALPNLDASSGTVILIGSGFQPGNGTTLSVDNELDPTRFMWNGANVIVDGFRFGGALIKGTGGQITIRRSKIDYLIEGLSFDGNCSVTLDRNLFTENTLGLHFNGCTVHMTNSILYQNNVDMLSSFLTLTGGSGNFHAGAAARQLRQHADRGEELDLRTERRHAGDRAGLLQRQQQHRRPLGHQLGPDQAGSGLRAPADLQPGAKPRGRDESAVSHRQGRGERQRQERRPRLQRRAATAGRRPRHRRVRSRRDAVALKPSR
jgi:hypothetical protein